jgi:hypothetical protein
MNNDDDDGGYSKISFILLSHNAPATLHIGIRVEPKFKATFINDLLVLLFISKRHITH